MVVDTYYTFIVRDVQNHGIRWVNARTMKEVEEQYPDFEVELYQEWTVVRSEVSDESLEHEPHEYRSD